MILTLERVFNKMAKTDFLEKRRKTENRHDNPVHKKENRHNKVNDRN